MAKQWKGDDHKLLPVQQVEPYRLWFEFLKLAHKDPDTKVDKRYYAAWGDVENLTFDKWWSTHWRELFAVDIGVRAFDPATVSAASDGELYLRVPLYQDTSLSLAQIRALLGERKASSRLYNMVEGQFRLHVGAEGNPIHPSVRFLKNLGKVRLLLNIYRFWLKHQNVEDRKRLELTTIDYFKWADGWNSKIAKGRSVKQPDGSIKRVRWNRPVIDIPAAIRGYAVYLEERGEKIRMKGSEKGATLRDDRRQISRYIRKARQITANTAKGHFPGAYE